MGKRRVRSKYTSKGERPNVSKEALKLADAGLDYNTKILNKVDAWLKGKNPWITIAGTTKKEAFVKVRANEYWGSPFRKFNIFRGQSEE
jgi:hypothetical protein